MRSLILITLAVLLLFAPAAADSDLPPFPLAPGEWEGTWDMSSTFSGDEHVLTLTMSAEQPDSGWTQFDVVLDSSAPWNQYSPGQLVGLCWGSEGRMNIGYYTEDDKGKPLWNLEFILDHFDLDGPMARYWGPGPNEYGIATRR